MFVLDPIENFFNKRIPVEEKQTQMADMWPIENVWAILLQRLGVNEFKSFKQLKNKIIQEWKNFEPELCDHLMSYLGRRLKAVVKKNGDQVVKKDYN